MNTTTFAARLRSAYGKIILRALNDSDYKERLISDPYAVLRESGVAVPPEVNISFPCWRIRTKTCIWCCRSRLLIAKFPKRRSIASVAVGSVA